MPQPLQTPGDVTRIVHALRCLLELFRSDPLFRSQLASKFDGFRASFGDGSAPAGVSVDSNGWPDLFGLRELIRTSSAISDEGRDALAELIDVWWDSDFQMSPWIEWDGPDHISKKRREKDLKIRHRYSVAPIRVVKQAICRAIDSLQCTRIAPTPPNELERSAPEEGTGVVHAPEPRPTGAPMDTSKSYPQAAQSEATTSGKSAPVRTAPPLSPDPSVDDPVFTAAASIAARRREYTSRCERDHNELRRLIQLLDDAAVFAVHDDNSSNDAFAREWAIVLTRAGQAIFDADLTKLVIDDATVRIPARLARAALRASSRGQSEVEGTVRRIVADMEHRDGVRTALRDIAGVFSNELRQRYEAALRRDFPDLAPPKDFLPIGTFEKTDRLTCATASRDLPCVKQWEGMFDNNLNPFHIMAAFAREMGSAYRAWVRGGEPRPKSERMTIYVRWNEAREAALRLSGMAGLSLAIADSEVRTSDAAFTALHQAIAAGDRSVNTGGVDAASVRLFDLGLLTDEAWRKNYSWNPPGLLANGTNRGEGGAAKPRADPFIPLTSWNDILAGLNEPHGKAVWKNNEQTRDKIRKLNNEHNGPIKFPQGKGKQPSVDKAALMSWWGGLGDHFDARIDEEKAEADSARVTVADSHNYGASGTVVPGIGGSEKRTRAKRGEKGKEGKR